MTKRIGAFGASANPPHNAYLEVAKAVHKRLQLDEIWLLVTPQNWQKQRAGMAPLKDRLAMCHLLVQHQSWLIPSDIEKNLVPEGQDYVPTAETLKHLNVTHPDDQFIWIMGADNLAKFHTWERWQEIADHYPMAILNRPGYSDAALASPAAHYMADQKYAVEEMDLNQPGWCFMEDVDMDLSSTGIREKLAAGQEPDGVPEEILSYILQNKLYQTNANYPGRQDDPSSGVQI